LIRRFSGALLSKYHRSSTFAIDPDPIRQSQRDLMMARGADPTGTNQPQDQYPIVLILASALGIIGLLGLCVGIGLTALLFIPLAFLVIFAAMILLLLGWLLLR